MQEVITRVEVRIKSEAHVQKVRKLILIWCLCEPGWPNIPLKSYVNWYVNDIYNESFETQYDQLKWHTEGYNQFTRLRIWTF